MKKILTLALLPTLMFTFGCGNQKDAAPTAAAPTSTSTAEAAPTAGKKILVTYYSWGGNTKYVAEEVAKKVNGDLVEIIPTTPYPTDYRACTEQAKTEINNNFKAPINTKIDNFNDYDVVFIGYPNWWGTMPPPIATFIGSYNFTGKTIVPFYTHGGGGVQRCDSDLKRNIPNAKFENYLLLSGSSVRSSDREITSWIDGLKF